MTGGERPPETFAQVFAGWVAVGAVAALGWAAVSVDEPWWVSELREWNRRRRNRKFGRAMCNVEEHGPTDRMIANIYGKP